MTTDLEQVRREFIESAPHRPGEAADTGLARVGKIRVSRSGAHWFDRSSGINILLDDVVFPESLWSRAPMYVSIALTNSCELKCPFCYAPKIPARLARDDVLAWVVELDQAGGLGIGFGGGEPTAHPDFAEICREATRRTKMAVTFTTHGHRITPELADLLAGNIHFIRVSMDGCGRTYERIRGRTFSAFVHQLELIRTIAPFGLNVVVNDETVGELNDVDVFADRVGAQEILLLPEQPVGSRPGLSKAAAKSLAHWIQRRTGHVRLAISEAGIPAGVPTAPPFAAALALDKHAHVDAQGLLRPNAYSTDTVRIGPSLLDALSQLGSRRPT